MVDMLVRLIKEESLNCMQLRLWDLSFVHTKQFIHLLKILILTVM